MIIYLFVGILAMSIAVSLLLKRYKKRKQQALEGVGKTTPAPEESLNVNRGGAARVKGLTKSKTRSSYGRRSLEKFFRSFHLKQERLFSGR